MSTQMPFEFMYSRNIPAQVLFNYLKNERPQIIALVLIHLKADEAFCILNQLHEINPSLKDDVLRRIRSLERVNSETIARIDDYYQKQMENIMNRSVPVSHWAELIRQENGNYV